MRLLIKAIFWLIDRYTGSSLWLQNFELRHNLPGERVNILGYERSSLPLALHQTGTGFEGVGLGWG